MQQYNQAPGPINTSAPNPLAQACARLHHLFLLGNYIEAGQLAQKLMLRYPGEAFFPNALGNIQRETGDLEGAAAAYETARQINPDFPEAWINSGHIAIAQQQFAFALSCFTKAVALLPKSAETWFGLAKAQHLCGNPATAEEFYRKALALDPSFALGWNNLGCLYRETHQLQESERCLRRAVELKPDNAEAMLNLAVTFGRLGLHALAEQQCRRSLALSPKDYSAHYSLGRILCDSGQLEPGLACYHEALRLAPGQLSVLSTLLFTLRHEESDCARLYKEAQQYGVSAAGLATARYQRWNVAPTPARLRIGFVSGDQIAHPIGCFLENVLLQLDPAKVELYAYPNHNHSDAVSARIRPLFSQWQSLAGHSDTSAAALIHADSVHILIDLAGHSPLNRLGLFAWKPAPVQVSWLGCFDSSGLATMDYLLADPIGVPPQLPQYICERIAWLPDTRLCFTPPTAALEPNPLPALQHGSVTFGCFQQLAKITDRVLATWARVLATLPASRLRIQNPALGDPVTGELFRNRLRVAGIKPERVKLLGRMEGETCLAQYHGIDLLLDTFPYPGDTTTCEALWMGVPTLTLAGNTLLSRQGASLLCAAGLHTWVAASPDEFVSKACAFAGDLPALAKLRSGLRAQLLASPLCDAPRFARHFEQALLNMWAGYAEPTLQVQP